MNNLEPRIEAIRQEYGLDASDFWKIKQNGQWVCKHAALEIIAVKAKIEWLPPQIIEANAPALVTSMIVTGKMGARIEWSTGETNPTNYSVVGKQPAYPWAMSEKRAKDRVVLKLVGIHGLVYSDSEGDFEEEPQRSPVSTPPKPSAEPVQGKTGYNEYTSALMNSPDLATAKAVFAVLWRDAALTDGERDLLKGLYDRRKLALAPKEDAPGYVKPDFSGMDSEIPYADPDPLQQALGK